MLEICRGEGRSNQVLSRLGGSHKPLADLFGALSGLTCKGIVDLNSRILVVDPPNCPATAAEGRLEVAVLLNEAGFTLEESTLVDGSAFDYDTSNRSAH